MKRFLIVAHAPSRNTRDLLDTMERGERSTEIDNVEVRSVSPFEAGPERVLIAQAIVLGTTEKLGYISGALKDFFDRIYYPCKEKTLGLAYTLHIRAGHDGIGARRGVEPIVTRLRWRAVQEHLICRCSWMNRPV